MVDLEQKMNDILSDYYSTIGKFKNVSNLIESKSYEIMDSDDEETKKEKEGQQREILVDLGRVAEMAFKYIIKIKRMELYPQEPYLDTIDSSGNNVKGFKEKETLTAAVVRDFGNKVHASQSDIESVLTVPGIGPKAHNFNYLYLIIDKLIPDIRKKMNEVISLCVKSDNISKIFAEENIVNPIFVVFPNTALKSLEEREKEQNEIIKLINKRNQTISDSGDIFTRLRYYANNPFDKNFDIDEVYDMVFNIIYFIKLIHLNNENLYFDSEVAFSYNILKNNPDFCRFNLEEIKKIYSLDKIKNNALHIMDCIFYSGNLSIDEILEIINFSKIEATDYTSIFTNYLNLETILYFRSIGITDYDDMAYELRKKTYYIDEQLLNSLTEKRYSLEQYKELREKMEAEKYPGILSLLDHLSQESIIELKKYPETLSFFINEFYYNVNNVSYQYGNQIFKNLLNIEELRDNPNSWYGLDIDQLQVYYSVSKLLLKDPLNEQVVNMSNYYYDTIADHVRDNIEHFKDNQKLLCVLPLMLDCDDNKHILDILIRNGLDIENLRGFDSTIFCIPSKLVDVIEMIFNANNIPLIVDNKVNPEAIEIIYLINQNLKGDSIVNVTRRIPFYKFQLGKNSQNNPVVNDLLYERQLLDLPIDFVEAMEQFKEIVKGMSVDQLTDYIRRSNVRTQQVLTSDAYETKYK